MAIVTVFVFLLERFPGFEIILNSNYQSMDNYYTKHFDKCDPSVSDHIWENINRIFQDKNNSLHKEANLLMENITRTKFKEQSFDLENNQFPNEIHSDNSGLNIKSADLPNGAPYLVAIFETVTNYHLTALTCGGLLLTPHWVITSAACLDVLANYQYVNESTQMRIEPENRYSIVTNAVNPLEDGNVHNVTKIFIHPKYKNTSYLQHPNQTFGNYNLVLLEIEPAAVKTTTMKVYKNKIKNDLDVMVFGWILKKNSSGQDSMTIASFSTKTINSSKCKFGNSFPRKSVICLRANQSNEFKTSQLSSGGPALVLHKGKYQLLGAVQLDATTPHVLVQLFVPHYHWISSVIGND